MQFNKAIDFSIEAAQSQMHAGTIGAVAVQLAYEHEAQHSSN